MENISDIHIVSFDIPFPANYGGLIDVFYKAKALTDYGVKVHLHCFQDDLKKVPELEKFFYDVRYYQHDMSKKHLFKRNPFIVETRISEQLVQNLLIDNYPILMEGLHTTGILKDRRLKHRQRIVRTHNIEHEYYRNLAKAERNLKRKIFFFSESLKLKSYEKILSKADFLLTISHTDQKYFSTKYKSVFYVPAFHPHSNVQSLTGRGDYVLYHGNLSIAENVNAVTKLLSQVMNNTKIPFKIAGLNPPAILKRLAAAKPWVEIISNPSDEELNCLIKNAQVNILFTDQATGLKLKLLNALYNGRFVLANDKMLRGSNMESLCVIANSALEMKTQLADLMKKDFTEEVKLNRQSYLQIKYDQGKIIEKLIERIA